MKSGMLVSMVCAVALVNNACADEKGQDNLDDQASLARIVKTERDDGRLFAALDKLHDQAMLADIAKNGRGWQTRQGAIRKLDADKHKALLEAIVDNVKEDTSVRFEAFGKLNPDMEYSIVVGDLDAPQPQPVTFAASPKPTEEDIFKRKMRDALPYSKDGVTERGRFRTLGQLTKMCDSVAVGKVASVKSEKISPEENVTFVLDVDTVLFGDIPLSGKISITGYWIYDNIKRMDQQAHPAIRYKWNLRECPKPGDRALVFLTSEPGLGYDYGNNERSFHYRKGESAKRGSYHIARLDSGIRYLDAQDNTTNYLNAVSGYLRELRGEKRDAESYYALLRDLVQSPIQSIREDARSDLMYFIESAPSFDPKRILSDGHIDAAIKYWVEHTVIPNRENQKEK